MTKLPRLNLPGVSVTPSPQHGPRPPRLGRFLWERVSVELGPSRDYPHDSESST
jgi:hypothetical protein